MGWDSPTSSLAQRRSTSAMTLLKRISWISLLFEAQYGLCYELHIASLSRNYAQASACDIFAERLLSLAA
jgi:hypothetical protein